MTELSDIVKTISNFYPKGKKFDDAGYQQSKEFQSLLKLRRRHRNDPTFGRTLLQVLHAIFQGYAVIDWTNLEDANCYEYIVLLHRYQPILDNDVQLITTLGGKRTDLRIFFSILDKYYYCFIEETSYDKESKKWNFKTINQISTNIAESISHLREKLKLAGYTELSKEEINTTVNGIETELVSQNKVKLFHCLFTDLVTP